MAALCILLVSMQGVGATQFLRKSLDKQEDMSLVFEKKLLSEMEKELGASYLSFTNKRLQRIKDDLLPLVKAMPTTTPGKLDLPSVSYVVRRTLLDRHGWFVKGLEPESRSWLSWQDANPLVVLKKANVSANVTGLFESRFKEGLDLNGIAVLIASLEHLVRQESYDRVKQAYASLSFSLEDVLGQDEVSQAMDTYMSIYLMGNRPGLSIVTPEQVRRVRQKINEWFPNFPETQEFVRDVQNSMMPSRDYLYASEVMAVVDEVEDRYGRFFNRGCLDLKNALMEIEDQGIGGAGRVRLADFYDARLNKGRWQFTETADYLRQMGSLDDADPDNLKVIIPNYVNGPSNCVAATSYYTVCCIDECNGLFGHLERALGAPKAPPVQILDIARGLSSSTVASNRTLEPWLVRRMHEVAEYHGGQVHLHGRLFSQWMHYAYPRECSFPHKFGDTKMQIGREYFKDTNKSWRATVDEMGALVKVQKPGQYKNSLSLPLDEDISELQDPLWSMNEELIVVSPVVRAADDETFDRLTLNRCLVFLLLLGSLSGISLQLLPGAKAKKCSFSNEKLFV